MMRIYSLIITYNQRGYKFKQRKSNNNRRF